MARAIPVWPFDTATLKRFAVSYVAPIIAFVVNLTLPRLIKYLVPIKNAGGKCRTVMFRSNPPGTSQNSVRTDR